MIYYTSHHNSNESAPSDLLFASVGLRSWSTAIEHNEIHANTLAIGVHYISTTFANEHASIIAIIKKKRHPNTRTIGVQYILCTFAHTRVTIAHNVIHMHTPEQSECMKYHTGRSKSNHSPQHEI